MNYRNAGCSVHGRIYILHVIHSYSSNCCAGTDRIWYKFRRNGIMYVYYCVWIHTYRPTRGMRRRRLYFIVENPTINCRSGDVTNKYAARTKRAKKSTPRKIKKYAWPIQRKYYRNTILLFYTKMAFRIRRKKRLIELSITFDRRK